MCLLSDQINSGSLTIVGSGIQAVRQFTLESKQAVEQADKVLYLVSDPVSEIWVKKINPKSESLMNYYVGGKYRPDIYKEITQSILEYVREGLNVCLVLYGHPGVFAHNISHESINQARNEGFNAHMLPGISSEDCLFADLGIDPGTHGCQSFEATDFLLTRRKFDTTCHLILWQIGTVGDSTFNPGRDNRPSLRVLVDFLETYYRPDHEVFIYEASEYAICKPIIQHLALSNLVESAYIDYGSTLYIPPKIKTHPKIDRKMVHRLKGSNLKLVDIHFSIKKLFHLTSNK